MASKWIEADYLVDTQIALISENGKALIWLTHTDWGSWCVYTADDDGLPDAELYSGIDAKEAWRIACDAAL